MKRFPPARTSLALVALTSLGCALVTKDGGAIDEDDSTSSSPSDGTTSGNETDADDHDHQESGLVPDCLDNADCGDPTLVCLDGMCVPADDAGACTPAAPPVCGNGIVEAMEECEGGPDCEPDCAGWWDGGGTQPPYVVIDAVPAPGGQHVMVATDMVTGTPLVGLVQNAGDFTDSYPIDQFITQPRAVATDPLGNIYVAGARFDDVNGSVGTVVALDAAGNLRWTRDHLSLEVAADIAADATMVVVGGGVESRDVPAGTLWILDPEGNELASASASPVDASIVTDVMIEDGEIFGLADVTLETTFVVRWDDAGDVVWSTPASLPGQPAARLHAIAPDGAGGVWAGGADGGPLLLRLDASGNELLHTECFGGRKGQVDVLATSPTGRLAMGLMVKAEDGLEVPWFAVLTAGTIDFARQPGLSPGDPPNLRAGHPIFVSWWSDGSLVTTHELDTQTQSNWEIFFTP